MSATAPLSSGRGTMMLVAAAVGLTLVGKLGALGKDIVLASTFGAGASTDAFFIANVIPSLTWAAVSATIIAVFLPLYVAEREQGRGAAAAKDAVRLYVLAAVFIMAAVWIFASPIVNLTAPDASPETSQLAVKLVRIMALSFAMTGYVGVQNALQQANGLYLWPLAVPAINNSLTILAILIAAWFENIQIAAIGAVLAWYFQAPIQRWQTRQLYTKAWGFKVRPEMLRRIGLLSWPIAIGVFLDQLNNYIGIAIAGRFEEGAVSYVSYASRLSLFIANLVSWLVAYFLFPRIATFAARGEDRDAGRELGLGMVLIVGLTLPLLVLAVIFGMDLIRLVYGRGAFGDEAVLATTAVFVPFVCGSLFIGLRELLNRAFFSYQKTLVPMVVGLVAVLVTLALGIGLSQRIGLPGIGWAVTLSAASFVIMQLAVIAIWKPALLHKGSMLRCLALGGAAICAYFVGLSAASFLNQAHFMLRLIAGGPAIGLAYLICAALLDRLFKLGLVAEVWRLRGSNTSGQNVAPQDPAQT